MISIMNCKTERNILKYEQLKQLIHHARGETKIFFSIENYITIFLSYEDVIREFAVKNIDKKFCFFF